jgi:twitching motility protein PilT
MIDHINATRSKHVLTIEDPIEYRHVNKRCLITQREVGRHTPSFAQALKGALREDPDVILVGEMRDAETMARAITAAATGQLVLSTLHTMSAAQTVDRIVDSFEGERQAQVRLMLSESLKGVLAQRLIRRADGSGRALAIEILLANTAVAALIREKKTFQLASVMQTGKREGMQSMDDSVQALVRSLAISAEDAAPHLTVRDIAAAAATPKAGADAPPVREAA